MDKIKIEKEINEFGLSIIAMDATDYLPSSAHSIGLWSKFQHPDIIIFGLPLGMMQQILNEIGSMIQNGETILKEINYDQFFENGHAQFIPIDERNMADYFGHGIDYYKTNNYPALQLVWTDRQYKLPWDKDFENEFKFKQPLLDRNADFKFLEPKELVVLANKNLPILSTIHNADGQWIFQSNKNDVDAEEMTLGEIVAKNPSLNDLFDLDYGQCAEKENEKWIRKWI